MNFDAPHTRRTYSDRIVDDSWKAWCEARLEPAGKDVVDIGCGGGIYSLGFSVLNVRSVTGIDGSAQYIGEAQGAAAAQRSAASRANITFRQGTASATGLPDACADLVFERALIHHLTERQQRENAREALRILRKTGRFVVQDRTFEDVLSTDDEFWVRGTLFEVFPRLLQMERARRPNAARYADLLRDAGFDVDVQAYSEVRRRYASFAELRADVLARKGRSVLFELTDPELRLYCERLEEKARTRPLVEKDAWTVWLAKPTRNTLQPGGGV